MEGSQKRKVTRPLSKIRKLFNENQSHSESNQLEGAMENALQTMLEQNIVFPTTPSILSEKLQLPPRKLQKIINLLNLKHAYQSGLQVYLNEVDALLIAFCKDMDIENVVTNADLSRSEIATIKNISSQVYQRFNESNSSPKAS